MFPFLLSFFNGEDFKSGIPRFVWSVVIFLFCSSVLLREIVWIIPGEFQLNLLIQLGPPKSNTYITEDKE